MSATYGDGSGAAMKKYQARITAGRTTITTSVAATGYDRNRRGAGTRVACSRWFSRTRVLSFGSRIGYAPTLSAPSKTVNSPGCDRTPLAWEVRIYRPQAGY